MFHSVIELKGKFAKFVSRRCINIFAIKFSKPNCNFNKIYFSKMCIIIYVDDKVKVKYAH